MKSAICEPPAAFADDGPAPLDAVLITEELRRRFVRRPDYESENPALVSLTQTLADSPRSILRAIALTRR